MRLGETPTSITRAGFPNLGKKGDPITPVVRAYQELGVRVSPDAITQRRAGRTSGADIDRAVDAAKIVEHGRIPSRDIFFTEYGALGIKNRAKRTDDRSRAFRSSGLRMKLADELGVPGDILGDLARTLRIDLFYTPVDQLGAAFLVCFRETVEAYLRDLKRSNNRQKSEEISRKWNRARTVRNFYGILLHEPRATVTAWTPYEMEPVWTLSKNRLDHHSPLTPFDAMVLSGLDGDKSDQAIIVKIKADIGITVTRQSIDYYRAFLMGRIATKAQKAAQLNSEIQEPTTNGGNHQSGF